jgi:hypothetical protein
MYAVEPKGMDAKELNVSGSDGFCGFGLAKMRHNWPKLFPELGQHASTQVYQNQSHCDKPG